MVEAAWFHISNLVSSLWLRPQQIPHHEPRRRNVSWATFLVSEAFTLV
jgi:hypothetical protein